MKELSLHLLDIAKNSVSAGAKRIDITLTENAGGELTITITDDGRGMSPEFLAQVSDPFTTTRATRKVGLGIPLYRLAAEQTGGSVEIQSEAGKGTKVIAVFHRDNIDCPPLGGLPDTIAALIQGSPEVRWVYRHETPAGCACLDTAAIREVLGPDVPLSDPEVFAWMRESLAEEESGICI